MKNPAQVEALAMADAYLNDACLPTYTDLCLLVKAVRNNCRDNPQMPAEVLQRIDDLVSYYVDATS